MPSQHIVNDLWEEVKKETVQAVIKTKSDLKTTEVLNLLIQIGLKNVTLADYKALIKAKNKH